MITIDSLEEIKLQYEQAKQGYMAADIYSGKEFGEAYRIYHEEKIKWLNACEEYTLQTIGIWRS